MIQRLRDGSVLEVEQARVEDAPELFASLRQADLVELWRLQSVTRKDSYAMILESLRLSTYARTARIQGQIAAMFGVCPPLGLGIYFTPWCLTTTVVEQHKRDFLDLSVVYLEELHNAAGRSRLEVLVDSGYTGAIRWLRWLGFTVREPVKLHGHYFAWAGLPADREKQWA